MPKIDTLIFDFGDVFINLDKQGAMDNALKLFKLNTFSEAMLQTNINYELGILSTEEFLAFYKNCFPNLTFQDIIAAWNFIVKDFPEYRMTFLKELKRNKDYKLILLSNTNALHIKYVKNSVPFYEDFKDCFDAFYLSHKVHLRKPNADIFDFIISENQLTPQQCLFVDDTKANTACAKDLGFHVWNLDETREDVVELFTINKHLF